jgi:hypothetical protein
MRIHVGKFSFFAPPGFKDVTGYSFRAREERELLDVDAAALPAGVSDLDGLVASRRADLEDGMRDAVTIDGEGAADLAGLPARTLTFWISDREASFRGWWALALDAAGSYLQISYQALRDNDLAPARFQHAVASASLTSEPFPTPKGWVRRWAGKIWLDVPAHLKPPHTYTFLSPDETTRLEVSFPRGGAEPTIAEELEQDTSLGEEVSDRSRTEINAPPFEGALHTFTLRRVEDSVLLEDVVRRAHIWLRGAAVAHIYGRAPSIDAKALEAAFDALVKSVEQEGPR